MYDILKGNRGEELKLQNVEEKPNLFKWPYLHLPCINFQKIAVISDSLLSGSSSKYRFRHLKYRVRHSKYKFRHPKYEFKLVPVPVFLSSQVIKLVRVPVFLSSKLSQTGLCSSISQFKTESKWYVFQYFSVQNWVKMFRVPVFLSSKLIRMIRFPILS